MEQVRVNPHGRAPLTTITHEILQPFYKALAALDARMTDPENQFRVTLKPGQTIFLDNWRVAHYSMAYTGRRVLIGGFWSRDDFLSKARVLGMSP